MKTIELFSSGPVSKAFRCFSIDDFEAACVYVKNLNYQRISDKENPLLVLIEQRGTCSSKHALLKMLADENGVNVNLHIGIYKMKPENTFGIEGVFPDGFDYIPEAHAYLSYGKQRLDMTRKEGQPLNDDDILQEFVVSAKQLIEEKEKIHINFIREWSAEKGVDADTVWVKREKCIKALTSM